jgi:hypothetical protein
MSIDDRDYGENGSVLLLLDAKNELIGVYRKGVNKLETEIGDLKDKPFEYAKYIGIVRTGPGSSCGYTLPDGRYVVVQCP